MPVKKKKKKKKSADIILPNINIEQKIFFLIFFSPEIDIAISSEDNWHAIPKPIYREN